MSANLFKSFLIAVLAVAFAGSAHAGLASCTGTYNLGNSGTTALGSGGGSSNGCEQVDKNFTMFNYTPGAVNGVAGGSVPVTFAGTADAGPISVTFGSNGTWDVATNGTSTSASVSYNIGVDPNPPAQYAPPAGENYAIVALALGQQAVITSGYPPGTATDTITLYEYFCAGGATACAGGTAATGGINMAAPTAGFFVYTQSGTAAGSTSSTAACFNNGNTNTLTDCYTQSNATSGSSLISFAGSNYGQGFLNVYTFSTLNVSSGGDDTALNFFKETYFQELDTPEPATFGMMGMALVGLALLRFRKRA